MNKQWEETVKEIEGCRQVLKKTFGEYATNAIERLIIARIKLETINQSNVDEKLFCAQSEAKKP